MDELRAKKGGGGSEGGALRISTESREERLHLRLGEGRAGQGGKHAIAELTWSHGSREVGGLAAFFCRFRVEWVARSFEQIFRGRPL